MVFAGAQESGPLNDMWMYDWGRCVCVCACVFVRVRVQVYMCACMCVCMGLGVIGGLITSVHSLMLS